jgi:tetratricopeptide (TPR) repeat protein
LHGLHEQYLTWSKQINLLATAQTLSDKDIEEYLEITKSQNSDRSEALNVFALYEMQMGMSLIPLGNFQMAEKHFKSALARIGSNENREKGLILLNYGVLKRNMGKYKESQKLFNRVLKIAIDLDDLDLQGVATGNIGETYRKTNNFDQAINYLKQSVVLADEVGDRSGKGVRLGNLASAYVQTHRTKDAIKNYELAREIAIELNDQMGLAKRTANLGRARYMDGEHKIGEELIQEGLKTKKELGNKLGIAEDTFWLGTIENDKGNPQEARRYFQMAISNYEAVGRFEYENQIRKVMSIVMSGR